jgi:hypothetical protein
MLPTDELRGSAPLFQTSLRRWHAAWKAGQAQAKAEEAGPIAATAEAAPAERREPKPRVTRRRRF